MKIIKIHCRDLTVEELISLAGRENVLLRTADGREFLLAEMDDFDREIQLMRQQTDLMDLLDQRSNPKRTHTLDEVREALRLSE